MLPGAPGGGGPVEQEADSLDALERPALVLIAGIATAAVLRSGDGEGAGTSRATT